MDTLKDLIAKNDKESGNHGYILKRYDVTLDLGLQSPNGDCTLDRAINFLKISFNRTNDCEVISHWLDRLEKLSAFRNSCGCKPHGFQDLMDDMMSSLFVSLVDDGLGSKDLSAVAWMVNIDFLIKYDLMYLRDIQSDPSD